MKVIELFAGAGGAALGLEQAGFEHAALCEWNASACETLRASGLGPVVEGDVRDLDAIATVAGDSCDLMWSSFPCQAWSAGGRQQGAKDERNGWPWTVDAIDRFQPRWFVAENVKGLTHHSAEGHPDPFSCPRCYLENIILAQLKARFDFVGFMVIDGADLGLPQHRRRVFIWAGPRPIEPPRMTHADPKTMTQRQLFGPTKQPWVTMPEALGLGTEPRFIPNTEKWTERPAPTVCSRDFFGITLRKRDIAAIHTGGKLISNPRQSCNDILFMLTGKRRLSIDQIAQLQGLRGHQFRGLVREQYVQIGNAVPPVMAHAIGLAVMAAESKT